MRRLRSCPRPTPLPAWCARHGVAEALVGGFFVRDAGPSSRRWARSARTGSPRALVAFDEPWGGVRACVHVAGGARDDRPARRAAAGPRAATCSRPGRCWSDGGRVACPATPRASRPARASSTPTSPTAATRAPRSACTRGGRLLAVACDGRADDEAGLTMGELAEALIALGAVQALNLDGGGSTSLVAGGRLRNAPRESARRGARRRPPDLHGAGLPPR